MNTAIHTSNLKKHFRQGPIWGKREILKAVDGVDLDVRQGELFGLVGPNQAGKSTLIKLLCTLVLPTSGSIFVNGYDAALHENKVKASVGLVSGDDRSFYWRLTGRQNLDFFAALSGLSSESAKEKIGEVLSLLEIEKEADISFQKCSSGIRQRMLIARSLLNDPQILFLDEATKSLDPFAASKLRTFIKAELVEKRRKTVFMTTHQMAEAEEICDRIAIMQSGRIMAMGTLGELRDETGSAEAGLYEIFSRVTVSSYISEREGSYVSA